MDSNKIEEFHQIICKWSEENKDLNLPFLFIGTNLKQDFYILHGTNKELTNMIGNIALKEPSIRTTIFELYKYFKKIN